MNPDKQIEDFLFKYRSFLDAGLEEQAQVFMEREFNHLSKEAQDKILAEMLKIAVEDEVEGPEIVADIQEMGLKALDQLDEIERGSRSAS